MRNLASLEQSQERSPSSILSPQICFRFLNWTTPPHFTADLLLLNSDSLNARSFANLQSQVNSLHKSTERPQWNSSSYSRLWFVDGTLKVGWGWVRFTETTRRRGAIAWKRKRQAKANVDTPDCLPLHFRYAELLHAFFQTQDPYRKVKREQTDFNLTVFWSSPICCVWRSESSVTWKLWETFHQINANTHTR